MLDRVLVQFFLLVSWINVYNYAFSLGLKSNARHIGCMELKMLYDAPEKSSSTQFGLGNIAFSLLPLSPESVGRRKTLITEVVPGKVYTLDQRQGIINVDVPVRCTIIKLKEGLFVHNPVAPTPEAIALVKDLEKNLESKVKYVILSSLGIEHKGTTGVFAAKFPDSKVWVQPGQYSFPLNLPTALFFPLSSCPSTIPSTEEGAPWADEIEHRVLGPLVPPGIGGFSETAFFHKASKTLLVTDSVIYIKDQPPSIINEDPRALLYHARDDMFQIIQDTPANRRKGWRRMVLFGLTFQPKGINILDTFKAIKMLPFVTQDMKKLGDGAIPFDGGFYPWEWIESDQPSFNALKGGLLVAPILQTLIFNRNPEAVLSWADDVVKWPFKRIISCHFENDVKASPKDFRQAFNFLEVEPSPVQKLVSGWTPALRALPGDNQFLSNASKELTRQGVLFPESAPVKVLNKWQR